MLLRSSRLAGGLTKLSASVPGLPELAGENGATLTPPTPHGTDGRLRKLQAPRNKLKMIQGPRQHAPRISPPGT
jgi:hypothetical protein